MTTSITELDTGSILSRLPGRILSIYSLPSEASNLQVMADTASNCDSAEECSDTETFGSPGSPPSSPPESLVADSESKTCHPPG